LLHQPDLPARSSFRGGHAFRLNSRPKRALAAHRHLGQCFYSSGSSIGIAFAVGFPTGSCGIWLSADITRPRLVWVKSYFSIESGFRVSQKRNNKQRAKLFFLVAAIFRHALNKRPVNLSSKRAEEQRQVHFLRNTFEVCFTSAQDGDHHGNWRGQACLQREFEQYPHVPRLPREPPQPSRGVLERRRCLHVLRPRSW